jgi:hypothetical protein
LVHANQRGHSRTYFLFFSGKLATAYSTVSPLSNTLCFTVKIAC